MDRREMLTMQEVDAPRAYTIVGVTQDGDGEIVREFPSLDEAKHAGKKLWDSGLVRSVRLHKPTGKSHRLVRDGRCSRSKRGRMTWTR